MLTSSLPSIRWKKDIGISSIGTCCLGRLDVKVTYWKNRADCKLQKDIVTSNIGNCWLFICCRNEEELVTEETLFRLKNWHLVCPQSSDKGTVWKKVEDQFVPVLLGAENRLDAIVASCRLE